MKELNLMVRTADQARKAELRVSSHNTAADIIQGAITNWSLPKDTDYTVVNVTTGKALNQNETLAIAGVNDRDMLEIQPVLVAGRA
jgi:hypothetical protein